MPGNLHTVDVHYWYIILVQVEPFFLFLVIYIDFLIIKVIRMLRFSDDKFNRNTEGTIRLGEEGDCGFRLPCGRGGAGAKDLAQHVSLYIPWIIYLTPQFFEFEYGT